MVSYIPIKCEVLLLRILTHPKTTLGLLGTFVSLTLHTIGHCSPCLLNALELLVSFPTVVNYNDWGRSEMYPPYK